MKMIFRTLFFFAITGLILSSCISLKEVSYVQSEKSLTPQELSELYFIGKDVDNKIRPGDELYIRISSADEGQTAFNLETQRQVYDPSLLSYTVDENGQIKLPYIGRTSIEDLTLSQASDSIENGLAQYLYYPSVFIKFINNKVTLLGEVNDPGVYVFNYKNINILQAIGYASEISPFGNRKNVLLIREEGAIKTKHYLDLTDDDLLESEYYLLKSNDIVYVEPLKRKKWGMVSVPYDLILSIISTTIVILTFVNTQPK